jgi:predicted ABC-type ATPase
LKKGKLSTGNKKKILRLRVFAGPNGSGKTTVLKFIRGLKIDGRKIDLGHYVNADDIAEDLDKTGISFEKYSIKTTRGEFVDYALASGLINKAFKKSQFLKSFKLRSNHLSLFDKSYKEYLAQVIADFLRRKLLSEKKKFSFETVFSHSSKLDIMREAMDAGYKVYLYFVSTESPKINVFRVRARKKQGGHNVPADKIRSRYRRSMENMFDASLIADQSYFFDNSSTGKDPKVIAQVKKTGLIQEVETYGERPYWFIKYFSIKQLEYYEKLDS